MTVEEIEISLKRLADVQLVQSEFLTRLERVVAQNTEAIAQHTEAIGRHTEVITKLADGMQLMQSAMERLFEHMDRFIRGLESDGHETGEE